MIAKNDKIPGYILASSMRDPLKNVHFKYKGTSKILVYISSKRELISKIK
jgi:hypothetical protein